MKKIQHPSDINKHSTTHQKGNEGVVILYTLACLRVYNG